MLSSNIRRSVPVLVSPCARISMISFMRYLSKVPGDTPEIKKPGVIPKRKTSKLDDKVKTANDKPRNSKKVETTSSTAYPVSIHASVPMANTTTPPPETIPSNSIPLPKVPEYIAKLSTEEIYKSVGLESPPEPSSRFIDFKIPDKYMKSLRKKPEIEKDYDDKERNIVSILDSIARGENQDESGNLPLLSIDIDNDVFIIDPKQRPHPLKFTLSGMLELNPGLNDIEDEYLWDNLPLDGSPPYQKTPLGFKEWEREQIEKRRIEKLKSEEHDRKYAKLKAALANPKAFYKKVGGRTKVDRKLLKQYMRLKEEGKIPDEWRNSNIF